MPQLIAKFAVSLATCCACISVLAQSGRNGSIKPAAPAFEIIYHRGEAVNGLTASPLIRLPFQCTGDGTTFLTVIPPTQVFDPLDPDSQYLVSVGRTGQAHAFRLAQVSDLQKLQEIDRCASDSAVVFLVKGVRAEKDAKQFADHHLFAVKFDRDGKYRNAIQLDDAFHIQKLGLFSNGTFLAYGWDDSTHAPKVGILREDGSLLRYIDVPEGDLPESAMATRDNSGKGPAVYLKTTQLVPYRKSILVIQNKSGTPILDIDESGGFRQLRPELPDSVTVNMVIPSDEKLYVLVGEVSDGKILEIDTGTGDVLAQFSSSNVVACVHNKQFLSFDYGSGSLVPLVGTPQPSTR